MTDAHVAEVSQLSAWLQGTDITLLELSGPGKLIRLLRSAEGAIAEQPAAVAAPVIAPAPATQTTVVRAGCVGVLLHAHPLRSEPMVRVGQEVAAGQPVALLKIGLVLLPVPAPHAGVVSRIVASDGAPVGFGDALLELS